MTEASTSFGRQLERFLLNDKAGARFLFVAPAPTIQGALDRAFSAINAEPALRGRYLLSLADQAIVDRRTKARLRFSCSAVERLVGERPDDIALDERLAPDERKRVCALWGGAPRALAAGVAI